MMLSFQQRVSPPIAGTVTVVVGLVAAIVAGFLIAHPPFSIPGAVLLVLATILICVGAIWRLKRTWADPWPPYTPLSRRKLLRRMRILFVFNCVFLPVILAGTIYSAANGEWLQMVFGLFIAASPALNLFRFFRFIQILRDQADETPGA